MVESLSTATDYQGVTGRLQISSDGEINRRMTVLRMQGGDGVEVMSGGVTTGYIADESSKEEANSG